jgi:hypothetical protein
LQDDARYIRALALSRLAYYLENMTPLVSAAALLVFSFNALFVFNSMTFLISALLVVSVHLPVAPGNERSDNLQSWQHKSISFPTSWWFSYGVRSNNIDPSPLIVQSHPNTASCAKTAFELQAK